jgi:hypothetical protein
VLPSSALFTVASFPFGHIREVKRTSLLYYNIIFPLNFYSAYLLRAALCKLTPAYYPTELVMSVKSFMVKSEALKSLGSHLQNFSIIFFFETLLIKQTFFFEICDSKNILKENYFEYFLRNSKKVANFKSYSWKNLRKKGL